MKKIIAVILTLCVAAGFAFAQSEASALPEDELQVDLTKKIITPKNQHLDPEDKTGKVVIEFCTVSTGFSTLLCKQKIREKVA